MIRPFVAWTENADAQNALVRLDNEFHPLVPPRGSVAAHVQAAVPQCRVVAQHVEMSADITIATLQRSRARIVRIVL